ncbi:hypothetical protein C8Q77DRAFT_1070099 [Trametes polyzona]|nr:hypothetical protein C8Q77DRAFT_1070099 [Trametes polyzona]
MNHIPTAPGQSFSLPLALSASSAASPSSASSTALDSPQPYTSPHNRRASLAPTVYCHDSSYGQSWEIDRDDERYALVESLQKSVTIVFWYQSNTQPLRLYQEIPTFPMFSFNCLTEIVEQLRLPGKTYLDTFNPRSGVWEQQQISASRRVESEQRLLYRIRRGLFEGLRDEECPGLDAEIALQEDARSTRDNLLITNGTRKRPADSSLSPPVNKYHRTFSTQTLAASSVVGGSSEGSGVRSPFSTNARSPAVSSRHRPLPSGSGSLSSLSQTQSLEHALGSPLTIFAMDEPPRHESGAVEEPSQTIESPPQASQSLQATLSVASSPEQNIVSVPVESPNNTAPQPNASTTAPQPNVSTMLLPIPALSLPNGMGPVPRKWPNDFFVYEIAAGLRAMDDVAAKEPALKQDEVFRRVFELPYVKSTFCRHRALWRAADGRVRAEFEHMGRDPRACWGEFARRVEGREDMGRKGGRGRVPGKAGSGKPQGVGGTQGEEGEEGAQQAQERMMNVIGISLPMIMATIPGQMHGAGSSAGATGVGLGSGPVGQSGASAREDVRPQGEEPVMGSLRPPEDQHLQQSEYSSWLCDARELKLQ